MRVLIKVIFLVALISGCSQPVVIYQNRIYAGYFERKKIVFESGEYNKLKGFGLSFGYIAFGIGYYDIQMLMINKNVPAMIESPIAKVWINKDIDDVSILSGERRFK